MNSNTSTSQRNFTFDESRRQNKSPVSWRSKLQIGSVGTVSKKIICHQRLTGIDSILLSICEPGANNALFGPGISAGLMILKINHLFRDTEKKLRLFLAS